MSYQVLKKWDFNRFNDTDGWYIPQQLGGMVTGGALWLKIASEGTVHTERNQIYANKPYEIASPTNIGLSAFQVKKVRLRVMNLSPETDAYIRWSTIENPAIDAGNARFTMKPYCREWQEVVCQLDETQWSGTLNKLWIALAPLGRFGDIQLDWIALTDGEPRLLNERPDICSSKVVPLIKLLGITQVDFQLAFDVMDDCLVTDVPTCGFSTPFLAPGGMYGPCWWMLDTSLALAGAKWVNQAFTEDVIRGFFEVQEQNLDGRIDLYGKSPMRGGSGDLSAIPRYFEAAYDVARRTVNEELRRQIYHSMSRYLDWWISPVKRDEVSGLITGFFEESFGLFIIEPQTVAPIDLNVAVALGFYYTARIAEYLGIEEDTKRLQDELKQLTVAINTYMWNEEKEAYYNYHVVEQNQLPHLLCTVFDTFRMGICPIPQQIKLISKLVDTDLFNWGKVGLTSAAKTDSTYMELKGTYDGRAWSGDIWTMRNLPIIAGLQDIGRHDLASELTWQTIKIFNANYMEFLEPTGGTGHGVGHYAWTAAQYIQAIVENLFGIDYDRLNNYLRIFPHIPAELSEQTISLKNLLLPTVPVTRLNIVVLSNICENSVVFDIELEGELGHEMLEIMLPVQELGSVLRVMDLKNNKELEIIKEFDNIRYAQGIRLPMATSYQIKFSTELL